MATRYANDTAIGDETGVAMAEALKCNNSLTPFTVRAYGTAIGDETGVAMAEALKCNTSLTTFTIVFVWNSG